MEEELSAMKHRLIWSFVFLIPLFYISMGHMMGAPCLGSSWARKMRWLLA